MNKKTKTALILALIIILGFLLRVLLLAKENFWLDEGFTLISIDKTSVSQVLNSVLKYETAPPLYFFMLYYWKSLFGISEFSLRFVSVIFSALSIFLVFLVSRKISGTKVALFASFFFTISMINVWYAQEARQYAFFIFLTLFSTLFLLRIAKSEGSSKTNYILYFISLSLSLYTFYLAVFLIFFHFLYLLFIKKYRILLRVFIAQLLSALTLLPWLLVSLTGYSQRQNIVSDILQSYVGLPPIIARFGQFALISPIIILSLALVVFYLVNLRYPAGRMKINYNVLAIVVSILLFAYLALVLNLAVPIIRKGFTWIRYFIFLSPAVYFIMALTLDKISRKARVVLLILILLTSAVSLEVYYTSQIKEQWSQSINFIEQTRDSGSGAIFIDEGGGNIAIADYYYRGSMPVIELAGRDSQMSLDQVKESMKNKDFAWLILSRNWIRGDYYKNMFDENFHLELSKEFYGVKLYLYSNLS